MNEFQQYSEELCQSTWENYARTSKNYNINNYGAWNNFKNEKVLA